MSIEMRQGGQEKTGGAGVPRAPRNRMARRWRQLAWAVPLLLGLAAVERPALAQQGQEDPNAYTSESQPFGKWILVCVKPKKQTNPPTRSCYINQRLPPEGKVVTLGLTVFFGQQKVVLNVRLPPAAKAGKEIQFAIDQNPALKAPIAQCIADRCVVRGGLDDNSVKLMRAGKAVAVTYLGEGSKPVTARASLNGFGQALDALRKTTVQ